MEGLPKSLSWSAPFLKKAYSYSTKYPALSYYLQLYVATRGSKQLQSGGGDPEARSFINELIGELTELKKDLLKSGKITEDKTKNIQYVKLQALRFFKQAVEHTEKGTVTLLTAKLFADSAALMETLDVYGMSDEDIRGKIMYAKETSVKIFKTLKSGGDPNELFRDLQQRRVAPKPEPKKQKQEDTFNPFDDDDDSDSSEFFDQEVEKRAMQNFEKELEKKTATGLGSDDESDDSETSDTIEISSDDLRKVIQVQKLARSALSGMEYLDFDIAKKNLKECIKILKTVKVKRKGERY